MRKQKCSLQLYTNFLIANQNRYSGVELSKVAPFKDISHDSISRFLANSHFTPSELWNQVKSLVDKTTGYLICDDSLLDKRYSKVNELAKKQYSGKEHRVLNGISLVNLLWTKGDEFIPIDYRVYQKENDDKTKNDHFHDMLQRAKQRGFTPQYVLMDAWYSSISNLKLVTKKLNWNFICNLKSNRQVSVSQGTYIPIADLDLTEKQVRKVWLKEYGFILVCKIVHKNGDITYLATNDLTLTDYDTFTDHSHQRWKIEEFHRGIKQTTGIEKCYSTRATSQLTHIFASFLAFVKLETRRIKERIPWYEQKASLTRSAVTHYLLANA
ncbi:MAG: IS701 family transposase [wastewater metagenome]|nr:IS701 family transposase [Candidatus Loosdrechtia aerotolerans]